MTNLGCTSPWGHNKDYICKNQTFGLQAHNLYKNYFSWKNGTRRDECLRTCNTMKLQTGNEQHEVQPYIKGLASARLEFRFFEMVTVTNEYYSYIWLNLLAEAGGYVGLFLGYSVFQITDVLDTLLNWSTFCKNKLDCDLDFLCSILNSFADWYSEIASFKWNKSVSLYWNWFH